MSEEAPRCRGLKGLVSMLRILHGKFLISILVLVKDKDQHAAAGLCRQVRGAGASGAGVRGGRAWPGPS